MSKTPEPEEINKRTTPENRDHFYQKLISEFNFKTFGDSLEVLWYDPESGIYCFNREIKIKQELEKIFEEERARNEIDISNMLTDHDRDEILKRIQYNTIVDRDEFDNGGDIINVANGLLDITTKQLVSHNPNYLSTKQFPIKYDPSADWRPVLKFLKQVQNREGVNTLLKMFGYILMTDTTKYQKAFFFVGRGNNGKSVLMDLIQAFVGKENCSAVKLHELKSDRFMSAQLYGKIVNTYADMPSTSLSDVGLFKALVSGDEITAQHKYGKPFQFRNLAKFVCSGNNIPLSEGEDELVYFKRWVKALRRAIYRRKSG